jgi:hypothetical protein
MRTFLLFRRPRLAAVATAALAFWSASALAVGTASNTDIVNNASVNYTVGGVAQSAQSNAATFKVDNVVRIAVSEANGVATPVAPGSSAQVTSFTVTNQGNTAQDFALTPNGAIPTGTTLTLGANTYTDAFDGTACTARVESGATPGYQPAEDTAQAVTGLAADASRTVYVVCNIPPGQANGLDAIIALTAQAANAGTCATTCVPTAQTAGADNPAAVDVVFGDVAGTDDAARDGRGSARDAYEIASAVLAINKTVTPVCDPFNNNANPKNVPGAYVRYAITVSNAAGAGASATLTTITDALPATLAFDPDLRSGSATACATSAPTSAAGAGVRVSCTGGTRACVATPAFYTGAADADPVTVAGQSVTAAARVLPTETGYAEGELKPGESVTITFNAVIQ